MSRLATFASLVSLAASCLLGGCASEVPAEDARETNDAIVGGAETSEFAAIGYLGVVVADKATGKEQTVSFCTGTLIESDIVLTAAHCIESFEALLADPPASMTVQALAFGQGEVGGPVVRATPHKSPKYKVDGVEDVTHDVAYLVLERAIPDVELAHVRPTTHRATCNYVATGYGANKEGHKRDEPMAPGESDIRKSLPLCADAGYSVDGMISAFSEEGTPCHGDSGGPLRVQGSPEIVGVASYIVGGCNKGSRAFYAPMTKNLDFIDEALGKSRRN